MAEMFFDIPNRRIMQKYSSNQVLSGEVIIHCRHFLSPDVSVFFSASPCCLLFFSLCFRVRLSSPQSTSFACAKHILPDFAVDHSTSCIARCYIKCATRMINPRDYFNWAARAGRMPADIAGNHIFAYNTVCDGRIIQTCCGSIAWPVGRGR